MPLSYRIDTERAIVVITGDYAEPAEWRMLLAKVLQDPGYQRGSSFIRDLRDSQHPVDAQTVVGIIRVVREFWPQLGARRAAMVTRPGIDAPAMIAEALAGDEQMPLRAFTSFDEAVQWLRKG